MKYVKYLIAIIFVIPFFVLTYLVMAPIAFILTKCGKKKAAEHYKSALIHAFVWWVCIWFGIRLKVEGKENMPSFFANTALYGNHQSVLDIVVLVASGLWCGFVGKVELKKIPVLNGFFKALTSVYIDRKSPRDSIKAIITASDTLKDGHPMAIFPEGTRSKDSQVHEFKAGSFKMATRAGADIVPFAIYGTRRLLENCHSLLPKKTYIKFAPAISTKDLTEEEIKALPSKVEAEVKQMYEELAKK